jgi:hypothetical protein
MWKLGLGMWGLGIGMVLECKGLVCGWKVLQAYLCAVGSMNRIEEQQEEEEYIWIRYLTVYTAPS